MISRTILPVIWQNDIAGDLRRAVRPRRYHPEPVLLAEEPGPGGIIWGVGPAFLVPTGTDDLLGTGKWGAGPRPSC